MGHINIIVLGRRMSWILAMAPIILTLQALSIHFSEIFQSVLQYC